jgi:EmrB/QacA subfamily drug resistance transporter
MTSNDELTQLTLAPAPVAKGGTPERLDPRVWRVAAVVFLGPFMTQMDSTVVNVSLSTIRQELHSSIESAQWIISGYLLALALMLPLNGWLVDRLGAKRLYLGCFSAFTLASLLCGAARTMDQLICARVIQGIAGGLLAPMTQLMLARIAGKHMARVMGYTAVPVLVAPILGPVVAGAILKYAAWPWLFYVNLPVGILAVALAAFLLPRDEAAFQKRPFDFLGFVLISPGLACLLYGLEHVAHRDGILILLAGLICLGAFVWDAIRKKHAALIDLRVFNNRVFATATTTQFLYNGLAYSGQFLVPIYLIAGCGISPAKAGWMLAPMGLGMMCVYPLMGLLTDRFGCRAVSTGGVLLALLGTLPFPWMIQNQFSPTLMVICLFVRGAGQGAIGIPSLAAAYSSLRRANLAVGTTAINIVQRLGGPMATTAMAVAMSLSAIYFPVSGPRAFMIPFVAFIGLHLLLLASASRLPVLVHQMDEANLSTQN